MEFQFDMDGARWRAARRALLLRRLLLVFAAGSAGCVALLAIFGELAHWVVLVGWPIGVVTLFVLWRRSRIHPDRYPVGRFTVRASEASLCVSYPHVRAAYGWGVIQWASRSGFLVAWVRGAGVICIPPGTVRASEEARLREWAGREVPIPVIPLEDGYGVLEAVVDDTRWLQIRGAQVYRDAFLSRYRTGLRLAVVVVAVLGLLIASALCSGDARVMGLAVFDLVGILGVASFPLWAPLLSGARARPADQFTLRAGPRGLWVQSGRGTAVIDWERTTQILRGRGLVVVCIGANLVLVPEDAVGTEGVAEQLSSWRERALQPREVPRPEGVVAPDPGNPFAPPA